MRYFTIQEAEELIPELEEIYASAERLRLQIQDKHGRLNRMQTYEAKASELAIVRSQMDCLVGSLQKVLQAIAGRGCVAKGLDPFLVDFPHRLDGREIYLCWKQGEKRITHFHGLEDGFAGRRRLPAAARDG